METTISAADFVKVKAALVANAAIARAAGFGRGHGTGHEATQPPPDRSGEDVLPLMYHLTYRDASGDESMRVVTLRRVDPDRSGLKLICWCHAAHAVRCFSVDRIVDVFDVVTGEVHENADKFFGDHPLLCEPKDPVDYALRVCRHEVNVLVTVGAADGRFDEDEQDKVLIHVFDRMPQLAMDEATMRSRLCRLSPDVEAFETAMLNLGKFRRGDSVALRRSLRKLVEADGRITREEAIFVSEVDTRLS